MQQTWRVRLARSGGSLRFALVFRDREREGREGGGEDGEVRRRKSEGTSEGGRKAEQQERPGERGDCHTECVQNVKPDICSLTLSNVDSHMKIRTYNTLR